MDQNDKVLAYLQNTLSDEDRRAFETELAQSPDIAAEIAVLQTAKMALAPQDVPDKSQGWAALSSRIDREAPQPANTNRPLRLSLLQTAACVVLAVGLWQALAVPRLSTDGYFSPASETTSAPVLQIIFTETANMAKVSKLLGTLNATIISGPGAIGMYRVAFPDDESRQAAKAILDTQSDLIARVLIE